MPYQINKSIDKLITALFAGEPEAPKELITYLNEREITELDLRKKIPYKANFQSLSEVLKKTRITVVDLSANLIGAESARDFALALKGTQVTIVNLSYNDIGDKGACDFSLKDTQVTHVGLAWNNIGADGALGFAQGLKDTQVTVVNLSHNQIGDEGAQDFVRALKDSFVTTVLLEGNQIGDATQRTLDNYLKIQKHLAAYATMNISLYCQDKDIDEKLDMPYPEKKAYLPSAYRQQELAYAYGILKQLPLELCAKIAEYVSGNNQLPLLNQASQYLSYFSAIQDKQSPYYPLAEFMFKSPKSEIRQNNNNNSNIIIEEVTDSIENVKKRKRECVSQDSDSTYWDKKQPPKKK